MLKNIIELCRKKIFFKILLPITVLIFTAAILISYYIAGESKSSLVKNTMSEIAALNGSINRSMEIIDMDMLDQVKISMNILKKESLQLGKPALGSRSSIGSQEANDLIFGTSSQLLNFNLVDNVVKHTGGMATIFSLVNGDFVRISTNIIKDGKRGVGTLLDPKGAAIKNIRKGISYYGVVDVLGMPCITGYEPIKDESGKVIGVWFTGYQINSLGSIAQTIKTTKLNNNGFIALIDFNNGIRYHSAHITPQRIKSIIADSSSGRWTLNETHFKAWNYRIITAFDNDSIEEISNKTLYASLITGILIAVVIVSILYFLIKKIIINKLSLITAISAEVASGKTDFNINIDTQDEIGTMQESFKKMIDHINEQIAISESISGGNLDIEIVERSQHDRLSHSYREMVKTIKEVVTEIKNTAVQVTEGDWNARGSRDKFKGEYKEIIAGFNETIETILKPVKEGNRVLEIVSSGDLTARVEGNFKGDFAIVKDSINQLSSSLNNALSEVNAAVQATASASTQISSSTEELAAGMAEQNQQAQEIASSVEEMTKTILDTTKNAGLASDASKSAGNTAHEGGKVVADTIKGMNRIAEVVSKSAETVQKLGKSSDEIGEIIQVIDDIADQTNLLALNAAIEAARAGEQGRGFVVVADEVRKLAERTTKATKEIAQMIKQIQQDTSASVKAMEEGKMEVEKGKELANKAGESLKEIITGTEKVTDIIQQVAAASEEQSSASETISGSIEAISSVTQQSSAGTQQIAKAAEDLNRLTQNLENLISQFKLSEQDRSPYGVRANGKVIEL